MKNLISNVRINLVDFGNTKAFADLTIGGKFVCKSFRVIDGRNGLFISMPSRQKKDMQYEDLVFPITKEARQELIDLVLEAYNKKLTEEPKGDVVAENLDDKEIPF